MLSFTLNGPIGTDANHDLDDVIKAKTALDALGFFKTPKYGLTPYPDQALFDGVKAFQKARHLKVDGVMKPGGETERAMGGDMIRLAQAASENNGQSGPRVPIGQEVQDPGANRPKIWNGRGPDQDLTLDDIKGMFGPKITLPGFGKKPTDGEWKSNLKRKDPFGDPYP